MAWHNHKSQEVVSFAGGEIERVNHELGQTRIAEMARGGLLVEPGFRTRECPLPAVHFPILFTLARRARTPAEAGPVALNVKQALSRDAPLEAGGDEIGCVWDIPVRQVSATNSFRVFHGPVSSLWRQVFNLPG